MLMRRMVEMRWLGTDGRLEAVIVIAPDAPLSERACLHAGLEERCVADWFGMGSFATFMGPGLVKAVTLALMWWSLSMEMLLMRTATD